MKENTVQSRLDLDRPYETGYSQKQQVARACYPPGNDQTSTLTLLCVHPLLPRVDG